MSVPHSQFIDISPLSDVITRSHIDSGISDTFERWLLVAGPWKEFLSWGGPKGAHNLNQKTYLTSNPLNRNKIQMDFYVLDHCASYGNMVSQPMKPKG